MVNTKRPGDTLRERRLGSTKFVRISLATLRSYDAVDKHNMRKKIREGFTYCVVNRHSFIVGNIDNPNQLVNWTNIAEG